MSSTKQKGTKKPKAVKSRPAAAGSALHAPADERAGDGRLCAFAPDGARLALVARAGAGERLRVFDALAGRAEAEMTLDGPARASCVAWVELDLDGAPAAEDAGRRKRRKRKSDADAMAVDESASTAAKQQLVALGRVDGSVVLFSPTHSRVLRTLTHAHASTAVLAVASASGSLPRIWTTSADGAIRLWDAARNALLGSWTAPGEATPFSALAPPGPHPDVLIAAHHGVRVFALPDAAADPDASATAVPVSGTLQALSSCTGHASPITALHWTNTPTPVLVSSAADDRSLSFWTLPAQGEGTLACTLSLDADIRAFALAPDGAHVLAVSAASVATIHALPPVAPTSKKLSTLPAASTVALGKQSGPTRAEIAAACFVPDQPGAVRVARLVGGVKPVFDLVRFLDPAGAYVASTTLKVDDAVLPVTGDSGPGVGLQRYAEGASVAVKRGGMLEDASDDDAPGALDADLAELSLGQRLATLPGGPAPSSSSDDEEGEGMPAGPSRRRRKAKTTDGAAPPPPATLTRTLTQALHSGDAGLLEACLAHAQPALVAASVARLPPALALPLLDACVARMGRAGAQRAGALGTWVRAALGAHGASLLADPLAVARLAGTHAVLAQRAALRDGLEALQGRLETALAQVELGRARVRREGTAATAPGKEKRQPTHYVEGESTDEEEDEDEDVLLEQNEDAASVEEVELGGSDDESDDDDDDDESGEEDDDDEGGVLNGFVDDEAEEYSGESEEDESD